MSRVLIATLGSLGDLNPAIELGLALVAEGHRVDIAANPMHGDSVCRQGICFVPLGHIPDPTDLSGYAHSSGMRDESTAFVDHANFTQLDALYDDLWAATEHVDLLLAAYHVVPAHLVAGKRGIPFLAYTLSPAYFVEQTRMHGMRTSRPTPASWHSALAVLRRRIGLPPRLFPYAAVLTDPLRMLGLFPRFLLDGEHDGSLQIMGYPRHSRLEPLAAPDPALLAFCDERTVVFSFGSFVDRGDPCRMFEVSLAACRALGLKCLYLSRHIECDDEADVMVRPFVDHAAIFPHAGVIVHHAGLGTLVAACSAGRPMVAVPFLYDQPYHAKRMAALIGAPIVPCAEFDRASLIEALRTAIERRPAMVHALAALMAADEDGFLATVREVERVLSDSNRSSKDGTGADRISGARDVATHPGMVGLRGGDTRK